MLLAAMLVLSVVSFSAAAEGTEFDISKPVTLRIFSISDAPNDPALGAQFMADLNAILKEKLNVTIEREYAAGNNYQNNYQLALASGEKFDLIHSARYLDFAEHAGKGAFMDLTDLIPVYAPNVWSLFSESKWNEVKVNGKILSIPRNGYDPGTQTAFMYREDLRKKYDLPEITGFETIALYLQTIKDNEPELLPSDDYQSQVFGTMFIPSTKYQILDSMNDMHSNFVIDPENPREVLVTSATPEYLPFVKMLKDWSDRGFWPKSVLSNMDWGVFSVMNGKAAASFNAQFPGYSWQAVQLAQDNPGWEADYFLFSDLNPEQSRVVKPSALSEMVSITRTADNPERALMLVDLIMCQDKELNQLVRYGYEGINYNMTEDGRIDTTGITQDKLYNYFPGGFFQNDEFKIIPANEWAKHQEYLAKVRAREIDNVLAGFVLNIEPVQAEYNAINQVRTQYGFPIQVGLVEDVDTAYQDFLKRLDDAGIEKVRAEFEAQVNAFLDAKEAQ
jgi:putative aldouronate transport system substrate-binding protein